MRGSGWYCESSQTKLGRGAFVMAVVIFDQEDALDEPLLQGQDKFEAEARSLEQQQGSYLQPSVVLHEGSLEAASSSSLDSSRKTLNQATMEENREREFGGGMIVELSKADSRMSRNLSMDGEESMDKEQDEDEDELLRGPHNMIINHSEAYRTLPRPYNPGENSILEWEVRSMVKHLF